jgi:hypothetical protein
MNRTAVVTITAASVGVNIHKVTIFGITESGQVESTMSHAAAMVTVKPNESARPHRKVAANNSVAPREVRQGPLSWSRRADR